MQLPGSPSDDTTSLLDVDGVAGVWSASTLTVNSRHDGTKSGQHLTYCFLDDDPVVVARRLSPVPARRWADAGTRPLPAAPFYPVTPHEWDRHVP